MIPITDDMDAKALRRLVKEAEQEKALLEAALVQKDADLLSLKDMLRRAEKEKDREHRPLPIGAARRPQLKLEQPHWEYVRDVLLEVKRPLSTVMIARMLDAKDVPGFEEPLGHKRVAWAAREKPEIFTRVAHGVYALGEWPDDMKKFTRGGRTRAKKIGTRKIVI